MSNPSVSPVALSFKAERVQLQAGKLPVLLETERIQEELGALPRWQLTPAMNVLYRVFRFASVGSALAFVRLVTAVAEELDHPVNLRLTGTLVTCRLSTPGVGGVTVKDLVLARRISLLG